MANTFTAHYNLTKPEVGAATNQWGGLLNTNFDTIDTEIKARADAITSVTTTANAALARTGGTMTGFITLHANPSANFHPATKIYVDQGFLPIGGGTLTGQVLAHAQPTDNSADLALSTVKYVKDKVSQAEIAAGAGLPVTGGTMSGYLTLVGAPTASLHAATKAYVDTGDAAATAVANTKLPRDGSQAMTGALVLAGNPTSDLHAAPKQYVDNNFLLRSGGTLTGPLILNGDPTNANGAATKNYVDTNFLSKTQSQTMGGFLTLFADPTSSLHAATKQYVDNYSVPKTGGSFTGNVTIPNLTISGSSVTATGATITCYQLTASFDITLSSDIRLKEDVRAIDDALALVERLRGVSYVRKDTKKASVGVIAQEVEQVIPALVYTDEAGMKSVAYGNMVGILIEAVKELANRVKELEAR